jgi:hypothetical protein
MPKQEGHQLIHPFPHPHSLSSFHSLSLYTLSHTPEQEGKEGEEEKGGMD